MRDAVRTLHYGLVIFSSLGKGKKARLAKATPYLVHLAGDALLVAQQRGPVPLLKRQQRAREVALQVRHLEEQR